MARPVVGITTYVVPAKWSYWDLDAALVPYDYVRMIEAAGGRPLLVPPSEAGIDETLEAVDALVFSGGSDLDPELYGQEAHPATVGVVAARDRAELALLEGALARDMPVLAICRGSQVMNVARGGDLVQHLPDVVGDEKHKHTPGVFADHDVAVEAGTRLGEGLRVAATAGDGTIEAVEDPSARFAVGVLWHPEAGEDTKLFEALVEEARDYRAGRGA